MSAPIVSINPVINSLNEAENIAKNTFEQCNEMIQDVISYSADKRGDLTRLKTCMTLLAETTKDLAALSHAATHISSLADRGNLNKEDIVEQLEKILNESLREDDIDEGQQQILSSIQNFIQEKNDDDEDSDENDVMVTKAKQSYKDPLTQRMMEDPVKSKICNHSFERSSIIEYLSGSKKKCPISGCQSMLRKEDLVDHFVLKMQIQNALKDEEESS